MQHWPAAPQAVTWTILMYTGLPDRMHVNREPVLVFQCRYIYYVVNQLMCRFTIGCYWKESEQLFISIGLELLLKGKESAEKRYLNLFYCYQEILNNTRELLNNDRFHTTSFICQLFSLTIFSYLVSYS